MTAQDPSAGKSRERSVRYPGVDLGETIDFCRRIDQKGVDGLPAAEIAAALGHSNVRTNSFSTRLSAARQFGLLELSDESYALTPRARSILHPVTADELPRLYREALLEPILYASLAARLAEKRLPDLEPLANLLYHHEHITASAKQSAAEAFLASARFAGTIDEEGVFRPQGADSRRIEPTPLPATPPATVRIDLKLWGPDAGKIVRIRAPERLTAASLDRIMAALRLHVRIDEPDGET